MIYLITNRHLVSEERYFQILKEASLAGVNNIILREKDLSNEDFKKLYYKVKNIVNPNTNIIINSKIQVFKEVKENTIHLSFKDFINLKDNSIKNIGVSVHTVEEGIKANNLGCSYILASHIFHTKCKEGLQPKGLNFIKELKENITCPIIALGGITAYNAGHVIKAGANGVALMSAFFQCESIGELVKSINRNY